MTKPVSGATTFGSNTSGTTTQLDNNFLIAYNALNDLNTYSNYLLDTGAVNAMVVSLGVGLTGILTDGLIIQVKAAATNTAATTLNYNGGGAVGVKQVDGSALSAGQIPINGIVQMQYSSSAGAWLLQTPLSSAAASVSVQVPVRQTVLSAAIDANGNSLLIPASCTSLNLTTANITASTPLIVTASNGFTANGATNLVGISNANLTWSNLTANQVNFLGIVVAANGNLTTVSIGNANGNMPVYAWGNSNTTGNGNYTFGIQNMQMVLGNGSAVAQTYTVFVGEANCNSNAVVTGTSYALMARFDSGYAGTIPAAGTRTSYAHNLGITPKVSRIMIKCLTTEQNFSVGDELTPSLGGATTGQGQVLQATARAIAYTTGSSNAFVVNNATTGALTGLTAGNWSVRMIAERGW